jgi:hypothetical protein
MKVLKYILIIFVLLVLSILLVAAFLPTEFGVEREVVINKPNSEVFNYVKLLKNQDYFSTWAMIDPNMKKAFSGVDGTVGFISAWTSDHPDVGVGEQEIIGIRELERIDYQLRFIEPFESQSTAYMIFNPMDSNTTTVKWGFDGEMDYPMNLTPSMQ